MPDKTDLRWGIIGPGTIARTFASALVHTTAGRLVAVAARQPDRESLRETFPGARVLDGYQTLLDDREVDAIYIATPHPMHAEWAIKAAEAGKHVLCEKPMAVSRAEAEAMIAAARKAGTFLGEAFMYRQHPMTAKLLELVRAKAIGEVRMIRSSIGFTMKNRDPKGRLLANDTAGGSILDIGGYPVSMIRLIAGAAAGKPFLDPVSVSGVAHLGPTGVDEWTSAVFRFQNGLIADATASVMLLQENCLRIYGTAGRLEVPSFWFGSGREGGVGKITVVDRDDHHETIRVEDEGLALRLPDRGGGEGDRRRQGRIRSAGNVACRHARQHGDARPLARRDRA